MYSNISHVTLYHFMLLRIFSLFPTKLFSLTPNISGVIKIFSWFFLQSWIIWVRETGFVSCTALWLNRVARFISKKEASFWLSNFFGLEMGTRFYTEKRVLLPSSPRTGKGYSFLFLYSDLPTLIFAHNKNNVSGIFHFGNNHLHISACKPSIISHMRIINQLYGWL